MQTAPLTTARLRLDLPTENDIDAITVACQDAATQRYTTVPTPYARSDAEGFVRLVPQWWDEGAETIWGFRRGEEIDGVIGLHKIENGIAEIGYWTAPASRGLGLLTEAAKAVVDWGFDGPLHLQRIGWRAVAGNIGSAKVARAVGIRYEGLMRGAFLHGDYRDDGWVGGILRADDRTPTEWTVLEDPHAPRSH